LKLIGETPPWGRGASERQAFNERFYPAAIIQLRLHCGAALCEQA